MCGADGEEDIWGAWFYRRRGGAPVFAEFKGDIARPGHHSRYNTPVPFTPRTEELEPGVGTSNNHHTAQNIMAPTVDRSVTAKTDKNTIIFNEVAVYFTEEEWKNLEVWQKELYHNVMKEIHATLVSLGYSIAYPHILCRIRKEQDSCIPIRGAEERNSGFSSDNTSVLCPDIRLKIKQEDVATEGSCFTNRNSAEPPACVNEGANCNHHPSNLKTAKVISPKTNTSHDSQLVFNPKFSLWIKQVDEDSKFVQNEQAKVFVEDSGAKKLKVEAPSVARAGKTLSPDGFFENFSNKENANKRTQTTAQQKPPSTNKAGLSNPAEESLLSIVLKRAHPGGFYMPNDHKNPELTGKQSSYNPKMPYHVHKPTPSHPAAPDLHKPHRCDVCAKHFKTVSVLNVHMKTHAGIRPYKCNECGKSFRDNWNLKVHQKIHTGETPYKCSVCNKAFVQYATYMKHRRIHTGEKPYKCCYCDKRFTNSSNLVRHHRTHTGEKPYACAECGKCFSYNTSLIQHKRVHATDALENLTRIPEK